MSQKTVNLPTRRVGELGPRSAGLMMNPDEFDAFPDARRVDWLSLRVDSGSLGRVAFAIDL